METLVIGGALLGSFVGAFVIQKAALEGLFRILEAERRLPVVPSQPPRHSVALEAGIQPLSFPKLKPWLRAGYTAIATPTPTASAHLVHDRHLSDGATRSRVKAQNRRPGSFVTE